MKTDDKGKQLEYASMCKIPRKALRLVFCLLFVSRALFGWIDHQHVTLHIAWHFIILLDEAEVTFTVLPPNPPMGNLPADVVVNTTYGVYTNRETDDYKMVVGIYDFPADPALELRVNLTAPTGGVSLGDVVFTKDSTEGPPGAQDCVTGVKWLSQAGIGITYTLHCNGIPSPGSHQMSIYLEAVPE